MVEEVVNKYKIRLMKILKLFAVMDFTLGLIILTLSLYIFFFTKFARGETIAFFIFSLMALLIIPWRQFNNFGSSYKRWILIIFSLVNILLSGPSLILFIILRTLGNDIETNDLCPERKCITFAEGSLIGGWFSLFFSLIFLGIGFFSFYLSFNRELHRYQRLEK